MTQKLHLLIWSYGNFPVYDGLKVEICSLFTGDKTESVQWVFWGTHCITVLRITFKPCDNFSSLSSMAFKDPFFVYCWTLSRHVIISYWRPPAFKAQLNFSLSQKSCVTAGGFSKLGVRSTNGSQVPPYPAPCLDTTPQELSQTWFNEQRVSGREGDISHPISTAWKITHAP